MKAVNWRYPALLIALIWSTWLGYTFPDSWQVIEQHWQVTLTMVVGSFIAGATSEGGGAIAFPVFTKVLHIAPQDAKVFSLAIQSVGMVMAGLCIVLLRIAVEWRVILWASLGGVIGIVIGTAVLAPLIAPAMTKMLFTAMIGSFAVTLFFSRNNKKHNQQQLPAYNLREKTILLLTGATGGCMSGLVGNGIDIVSFSIMVVLFRLCERIATPTSVILMAINAVVGFALHGLVIGGFTAEVQSYWLAAIPVVIIGAPLGAFFCTRLSNSAIVDILLMLITLEVISSLLLIEFSAIMFYVSFTMFVLFALGYYRLSKVLVYCSQ
jgi:uncharacterized protein